MMMSNSHLPESLSDSISDVDDEDDVSLSEDDLSL